MLYVVLFLDFIKRIYSGFFFFIFRFYKLENKVVFVNFSGKKCGDNVKIISDKLYENKDIKQVWIYHDKEFSELPKDIIQVKWGSVKMLKELATSKVWCSTHTFPRWVKKYNHQFYINTWHGGLGMKKIEGDAIDKLDRYIIQRIKHNSKIVDVFISNSDWLTEIYKRAFWYDGEILKIGYPKTDYLLNPPKNVSEKVHKFFKLDKNVKLLLYAPTMRNNPKLEIFDLGFEDTIKALKERFGGSWKILIRLHPVNASLSKELKYDDNVIDATEYPDILELTIANDMFVSDYSSGIFDAAIIDKKALTFAVDSDEYDNERGLYIKLEDLPFPVARNKKELYNNIKNFDCEKYEVDLKKYFDKVGLYDKGNATETIISLIEEKMR